MDTKIQNLNNYVRTTRYKYKAFQDGHDISDKFIFKHLGAFSTIYKEKNRPDLQTEYYVDCKLFISIQDKSVLKKKFKLIVHKVCYQLNNAELKDVNGIVTLKSLVNGSQTFILSDVMEKYEIEKSEIDESNVVLYFDFTKYRLVSEIFIQFSVHARLLENHKIKESRSCKCNQVQNYTPYFTCGCRNC